MKVNNINITINGDSDNNYFGTDNWCSNFGVGKGGVNGYYPIYVLSNSFSKKGFFSENAVFTIDGGENAKNPDSIAFLQEVGILTKN